MAANAINQSALTVSTIPLKSILDQATPSTFASMLASLQFGSVLRGQIPQVLRAQAVVVDKNAPVTGVLGTSGITTLVLPYDARCTPNGIINAYCRTAKSGVTVGPMTIETAFGSVSGTLECAVQPDGNICTYGADGITSMDVVYIPERIDPYNVMTITLPVSSNVLTLPTALQGGVVLLVNAVANTGTTTGQKFIIAPAATSGTAASANLNLAKTAVNFNSADAVTNATVTVLMAAGWLSGGVDLSTILENDSTNL